MRFYRCRTSLQSAFIYCVAANLGSIPASPSALVIPFLHFSISRSVRRDTSPVTALPNAESKIELVGIPVPLHQKFSSNGMDSFVIY